MFDRFSQIVDQHLIKATPMPHTNYHVQATVKGMPLTVHRVTAVTVTGNYAANLMDLYHITVVIPFRENRLLLKRAYGDLKVVLLRESNGQIKERTVLRGVVISNRDSDMESPTMFLGESDDKAMALAQFELMEESAWNLRTVQFGRIFRRMTPLDVLRSILARTMPNQELAHGELRSVEYDDEPQQPYDSFVIPDSTEFPALFDYLQDRYGVYAYGIGAYLQKDRWYLFRPYYANKFEESEKKLLIYNLPKEKAGQLDESLHFTDNVRTIITGGQTRAMDYQDNNALNSGTGYRVGAIRALDGRAVSYSPGEVAETTSANFVSQANPAPHDSGLVNARVQKTGFVDHDKVLLSDLAKNRGQVVQVTWHSSQRGVVFPGMGVKFMYSNDGNIFTRYGVVLGEVYHATMADGSMASDRVSAVSELTVWLSNDK